MPTYASLKRLAACASGMVLLAAGGAALAQSPSPSPDAPPPAFPRSSTPPPSRPAADMQAVLDAQAALGAKPIEFLTPAQARLQPSPADGVKAVLKAQGRSAAPDPSITTQDFSYSSDPMSKARVYFPPDHERGARKPVIVYFHGGGWVIADLDTYDATPRLLAQRLNAIVVSVEYRHAPEHRFPSQALDANYAYDWAMKQAAGWHGDRSLVIVAGESAGGNLAVNVAIHARDADRVKPKAILAIYPIASGDPATPSKLAYANAKPLNTPMLQWFAHYVVQSPDDTKDPRWDLTKADLHGLHPRHHRQRRDRPPARRRRPARTGPARPGRAGGAACVPRRDARVLRHGLRRARRLRRRSLRRGPPAGRSRHHLPRRERQLHQGQVGGEAALSRPATTGGAAPGRPRRPR